MASNTVVLVPVGDAVTRQAAESLIREYLQFIAVTARQNYQLKFDIEAMVVSDLQDETKFYPPAGRFYLVRHAHDYVGAGCLKRLAPTVAEVQRMYVRPSARGLGAGRLLLMQLLTRRPRDAICDRAAREPAGADGGTFPVPIRGFSGDRPLRR